MGYENIDEAARKEACERVKQIVKAIKAIKIKYYLNFSKISAEDQKTFQKLEANLEKIASMYNLSNLKVALMQEVSAKYDRRDTNDMGGKNKNEPDDILQACYGAIDTQKEALARGKITQARKCQEILIKYMQGIELESYRELIINYKREKFAELVRARNEVEEQNVAWNKMMKGFYKSKHVMERQNTIDVITNVPEKNVSKVNLDGKMIVT